MTAPQRFYSLDVLRGLAALSVVFWHWQHFFYMGTRPGPLVNENLPLFNAFSLLYRYGWLAVDLFFSLSGFVFFWLYSRKVKDGAISSLEFAVLRISRLYPLHLLTLLLVACGQYWFMSTFDTYFVYPFNDTFHFLLNLSFTSSWGMERGYSFNYPVWSVSVEMLLYGIFFVFCRYLPVRFLILLAVSLCGYLLIYKYYSPLGRGIGAFFLGGCMYIAYQTLSGSPHAKLYGQVVSGIAFTAWLLTLLTFWLGVELIAQLQIISVDNLRLFAAYWTMIFLFPLTILWLAMTETRYPGFGSRYAFLGDLSYSSYLLHFPLQMLTIALLIVAGATRNTFYSPILMISYFVVLIALSLASHKYFEVPMQRYLRNKALS